MQFYKVASLIFLIFHSSIAVSKAEPTEVKKKQKVNIQRKLSDADNEFLRGMVENSKTLIDSELSSGTYQTLTDNAVELAEKYKEKAVSIQKNSRDSIQEAPNTYEEELTKKVRGEPEFGEGRDMDRIIFVSFSMKRGEIRQALREASRVKARVVINGFLKGTNHITDTVKRLRALSGDKFPVIQINPTEFKKWAVTKTPVIAFWDGHRRVRATGVLSFDWLESKAKELNPEEKLWAFGVQGKTTKVEEIDLVEMMKAKLSEYDFEKRKEETIKTFWSRSFNKDLVLPSAQEDSAHFINPAGMVTKDIVNNEGMTLAKKGKVINPLASEYQPFRLYIFNPDEENQVDWVKKHIEQEDYNGRNQVVATHIDPEGGWEAYQELKTKLQSHVFALQPIIVNRFQITALPAVVSTEGKLIKVQQFNLENVTGE